MQVLGDLIRLPSSNDLPLPWWHRASLGLQTKTWCYVAIVRNQSRVMPHVIVSVLNPYHYSRTLRVRSTQPDEPGIVSNVIAGVTDMNIALAESATLETGDHQVTLICEPKDREAEVPTPEALKKRYADAGIPVPDVIVYRERPVEWMVRAEVVDGGWIRGARWRDELLKRVNREVMDRFDLTRAVVSADTTNRVLRFIFPLKGARTIRVKHVDAPGVLKQITTILFRHDFNLLSMLLRRGGASPGQAALVAVCEPRTTSAVDESYNRMQEELESLSGDLEVSVKLDEGTDSKYTIAPHEAKTVVARIPLELVQRVHEIRAAIPKGKLAVFFSHRFIDEGETVAYTQHLRAAIRESGCHLLEVSGKDDVRGPQVIFNEVSAHLWAADAGVILLAKVADGDPIGRNIPHEYGFLQGQAKPILLLVQEGQDEAVTKWTNAGGVFAPRFPSGAQAATRDNSHSLYGLVDEFVTRVNDQRARSSPFEVPS